MFEIRGPKNKFCIFHTFQVPHLYVLVLLTISNKFAGI